MEVTVPKHKSRNHLGDIAGEDHQTMTDGRRAFLGRLGVGALIGMVGLPAEAEAAEATAARPAGDGDTAPALADDGFDYSWGARLTGKAKAVFDSPKVSEGAALLRACIWRRQHNRAFGTTPEQCSAVVVARAEGVAMIMNDAYWARFRVGKSLKLRDAKGEWATANPLLSPMEGVPADFTLPAFLNAGGIVLACNMAFRGQVVSNFTDGGKVPFAEAEAAAKAHLVPGVVLQPSGVFAVLHAQELGCAYILGSEA